MPRRKSRDTTVKHMPEDWRIALYIRLSREDGNDESMSVTNQKKILSEYLELYFGEAYTVVDKYIDDGITGTSEDGRKEFQRMIQDVENGKVNCVICKTLSRIFRNYSDQGYYLENFFPKHKVRFISTSNPKVDSYLDPDMINGLEVPINGLINDRYAGKTSRDVRQTFDSKRRAGEFIGAFAPFGYQKDPDNKNHLIIDDEAAEIVRDIFHWFVFDGLSKNGIARRLNEKGIPNPTKYKQMKGLQFTTPNSAKNDGLWCSKTIRDILINRMYIGDMVQGKQKVISYKVHDRVDVPEDEWYVVPNTHKAVIDKELFHKVQLLQQRDSREAPKEKRLHLFSGLICCADCKKAMHRNVSGNYAYYVCRTFKDKKACTKHTIRIDKLENAVLTAVQKQIALAGALSETVAEINKAPTVNNQPKYLEALLEQRKNELEKMVHVSESLYVDWKNGDITRGQYLSMTAKYPHKVEELKQTIHKLEEEMLVERQGASNGSPYLTAFLKYKNINHLERGILTDLVNRIYVHKDGEITLEFNFQDEHMRMIEFIENNSITERQENDGRKKIW